ncbi:riboflavin kinase [Candidatus Kaiserbacteria bacterium]|nr:riboflavin kinase [Candidatus Kaiserbacteria bacterium]
MLATMVYRGIVQKGERRGTALGFPTANILLEDDSLSGIYIASTKLRGDKYDSAVFIDNYRKILEAHFLDFPPEDLYGEEIEVELLEKIREHESFEDDETLRACIKEDIQAVREYFKNTHV